MWTELNSVEQLNAIKEQSNTQPVVIFKHSTRCSISSMALNRLERSNKTKPENIQFYYLDLIKHRNISNQVATDFKVFHQSPQVLLIKNGECIYEESHNGIDMTEIVQQAS